MQKSILVKNYNIVPENNKNELKKLKIPLMQRSFFFAEFWHLYVYMSFFTILNPKNIIITSVINLKLKIKFISFEHLDNVYIFTSIYKYYYIYNNYLLYITFHLHTYMHIYHKPRKIIYISPSFTLNFRAHLICNCAPVHQCVGVPPKNILESISL